MFQSGECTEKDGRGNCAKNSSRKHQCSKCLSENHGSSKCPSDGPKQPRANHGKKGKGKGKHWDEAEQSLHVNSQVLMKVGVTKVNLTDTAEGSTDQSTVGTDEASNRLKQVNAKPCILHMFSGPRNRPDGLAAKLKELGLECEEYDLVNGSQEDLANDFVWETLKRKIQSGYYAGLVSGPPCTSFSNARKPDGRGPLPLRGPTGPDRYGLPGLRDKDREDVRIGTLLAQRSAEAARMIDAQQKPSITEQPLWKQDGASVSMFNLDEFADFHEDPNFMFEEMAQCEYGAATSKPTTLMLGRVRKHKIKTRCTHNKRLWRRPSTGERHWGAHPPLKGKEWYIPAESWKPAMIRTSHEIKQRESQQPYLTSAAQAYPEAMNQWLAKTMADNLHRDTQADMDLSYVRMGRWNNILKRKRDTEQVTTRTKVTMSAPLRGTLSAADQSERCWGGMRNPKKISRELPGYRATGHQIHNLLNNFLNDNPNVQERCLQAVGNEDSAAGPEQHHLDELRMKLKTTFCQNSMEGHEGLRTKLQPDVLWVLARAAGDPDADEIYDWLTNGAPAGISREINDPGGIFPTEDDELELEEVDLPDPMKHRNYGSVDDDDMAEPEVDRLIATGFVKAFDNYNSFVTWLNGKPHLSKMGMITKEKDGRTKRRLILDCKESRVNERARKGGKLILPRVSDVVDDTLYLMRQCTAGQQVEWLILDFTDWFFNVPLHPDERKNFTLAYKQKYVAYLTQAQGSVNAPLICGRVAALIARLTQALHSDQHLRLQLYVDDPILGIRGTEDERNRRMAMTILFWEVVGVRLAYKKASRGTEVVWIGAKLSIHDQANKEARVEIRAKEEIVQEVRDMTNKHQQTNVVPKKELQVYVGKLNHMAGIIDILRPFLADLYGVIHDSGVSMAPRNCVWTKQWKHVATWMQAFLDGEANSLYREYRVTSYFGTGMSMEIVTDASPWGLGGYLVVAGNLLTYFTSPLTEDDAEMLAITLGESSAQQVAEALAVLVALKIWAPIWKRQLTQLRMKSDSISTLSLLRKMRVGHRSIGLNLIARELALLFGSCCYKPRWLEHIPGVSNIYADILSRLQQTGNTKQLPKAFLQCPRTTVPRRDANYYRTFVAAKQDRQVGPHQTVQKTGQCTQWQLIKQCFRPSAERGFRSFMSHCKDSLTIHGEGNRQRWSTCLTNVRGYRVTCW